MNRWIMGSRRGKPLRAVAILLTSLVVAVGLIAYEVNRTSATRGAVHTYNALLAAANARPPDLEAARQLCTERYVRAHPLATAAEGGIVGLPRNIHTNFQVWREGSNVWLCPTNRVGPVYQFVREGGDWRFDGPVGLLMPGGKVAPYVGGTESPTP